MRFRTTLLLPLVLGLILISGCKKEDDETETECSSFFCDYETRNFQMGFSTWPYAPTLESVDDTYQFLDNHSDLYSEHIDFKIPWNAWMNGTPLPPEFTNEIAGRAARKIEDKKLSVSVSILNGDRSDLASDFDGTIPEYTAINDPEIEDAYFEHLKYIANQLNPDYLIVGIEVNELLINSPEKWDPFKLLMANISTRIAQEFPGMRISESITLHNLYQPDVSDPQAYTAEVLDYANDLDLVCISFYPYFKGLYTKEGFQDAFDFLHANISKPIAFAETSHLSEDLSVESYNLFIAGNQTEQNAYLETLCTNAQEHDYEYIVWWAHRDYNELWETFPEESQDLGKLWLSTGLMNEDGADKTGYATWQTVFNK